jgi:hypothetical protein
MQGMPASFRKYIVKPEDQDFDQQQEPASLSFQLGSSYSIDSQGNRYLQRQVRDMLSLEQEREALQQSIEELDETTAQALALAAEDHQAYVKLKLLPVKLDQGEMTRSRNR